MPGSVLKRHEDAHTAHEAKLEQGRRALEAEQKAIKAAKEAAEIDRREAKQLRAEVERRYAAFTA